MLRENTLDKNQKMFLEIKELEGLATTSINTYRKLFNNLNKKVGALDYKNYANLEKQIMGYFNLARFHKNSTYNQKQKSLNAYFNLLIKKEIIEKNPIKTIPIKKKTETFAPNPAKAEDIQRILQVIDIKTYAGFRDYVFITLLADTGIRPAEATRLNTSNFKENVVKLDGEITKTKTARVIPISSMVLENAKNLFDLNQENFDSQKLFLTEDGLEADTVLFQRRLNKYSKLAGVKITPYQLRHYFGTQYLKNPGSNLIYLQKMMGHKSLEMTKRYVEVDSDSLIENHKIASPLQNIIKRNTRVRKLFK